MAGVYGFRITEQSRQTDRKKGICQKELVCVITEAERTQVLHRLGKF